MNTKADGAVQAAVPPSAASAPWTRAALAAAGAFCAGYLLSGGLALPVVAYDPLARRVFLGTQLAGAQMRYYGDLLWASAAALLAFGLTLAVARRRPFSARLAAASVLALAGLDVAYYLSRLLAAP